MSAPGPACPDPALSAGVSAPHLHGIIDSLPQGLLVFGPDRRVVLVNRAYGRVMAGAPVAPGDSLEELLRRYAVAGEYGPGDPDVLVARHLAYDLTRPQTRRRRRPNGTMLENRWVPLADGGFMVLCTDVTALVAAEQALIRRGTETEILLGGLRHGLILWGPDRRLLAANPMAAVLMAVPAHVLSAGRPHPDLIDALLAAGYFGAGPPAQAAASGLKCCDWARPWLRHFVNRDGRFIECRADPVAAGMTITTLTDMTEQREAEQALRSARDAAQAANQAKSHFLATMSHELRTPLNAVIGYSDALVQDSAVAGGPIAEYAGAVNEAGRQLLGLIDRLLDVARLETGRFDLAEDVVDVGRLLLAGLHRFAAEAEAGGITLDVVMPAAPDAALPAVRADRRRLDQVLQQLLSNAVKFTPPGGRVTIGARPEDEALVLWIADTGIGIAAADLARVFDPFTQADAGLARRFPGAGLGLYLARAVVESHGGALTLSSRQGEGTQAEIRLPAHRLLPARPVPAADEPMGLEPSRPRPQDDTSSQTRAGPPSAGAGYLAPEPTTQQQQDQP